MLPNIHIVGIQGSGKGTQARLLKEKYQLNYLASGELFRARAEQEDDLGQSVRLMLQSGQLLSDDVLVELVEDYLSTHQVMVGLLGDGVLRTLQQHQRLQKLWSTHQLQPAFLLHLQLSEKEALERIENRIAEAVNEGKRREDDNPEAITKRFALFNTMTQPVVDLFEAEKRCITIQGNQSREEVHQQICDALESTFPTLASYVSH